jgi:hypothetical protein
LGFRVHYKRRLLNLQQLEFVICDFQTTSEDAKVRKGVGGGEDHSSIRTWVHTGFSSGYSGESRDLRRTAKESECGIGDGDGAVSSDSG